MTRSGRPPTNLGAWVGLLIVITGRPVVMRAQDPPASTISGAILDAESGRPLTGARIDLTPLGRAAISDAAGQYAFEDIAPGAYQVRVRLIGYRPTMLDVDLPPSGRLRLSVGLVLRPILLDPLPITSPATALVRATDSDPLTRVDMERDRQRRYLASDVRGLTAADLLEAQTVGEPDVLRALQRLPGVTTRDDFTAQLWTRGARWSDTRVYFDGLPLFNPVHAAGAISAVQPEAIGAAYFPPGVRSAALGEGAAAALELSSRAAADTAWNGAAEVSVLSARATVARRFAGGRSGVMLAARRSYVDLVASAWRYAFEDLTMRLDHALGASTFVEASGVFARDDVHGDVSDLLIRNRGHWGSGLGRVSLVQRVGAMSLRHSVGISQFTVRLRLLPDPGSSVADPPPSHEPLDNTLRYVAAGAELAPLAPGRLAWRAGYEIVRQSMTYAGGPPTPYARTAAIGSRFVGTDTVSIDPHAFRLAGSLSQLALWSEGRWTPAERIAVQLGLRADFGRKLRNAGGARLAPRVMVRYQLVPRSLSITAGWGRSFQYLQTLAPTWTRPAPERRVAARRRQPARGAIGCRHGRRGVLDQPWLARHHHCLPPTRQRSDRTGSDAGLTARATTAIRDGHSAGARSRPVVATAGGEWNVRTQLQPSLDHDCRRRVPLPRRHRTASNGGRDGDDPRRTRAERRRRCDRRERLAVHALLLDHYVPAVRQPGSCMSRARQCPEHGRGT